VNAGAAAVAHNREDEEAKLMVVTSFNRAIEGKRNSQSGDAEAEYHDKKQVACSEPLCGGRG